LGFYPTVDANLAGNFADPEIHYVTDRRQLALVELSPEEKSFSLSHLSLRERLIGDPFVVGNQRQRWFMRQRVVLAGEGDAIVNGEDVMIRIGAS
jgi:hypothetical protein